MREKRTKICGVYKVVNPVGEIYVGSSKDIIQNRWRNYKNYTCEGNPKLFESLLKFGSDNHYFEVVHELPLDVERRVLRDYEVFVWEQFNEAGYKMLCNHPRIGLKGIPRDEETKRKISVANKGKPKSYVPWNKGKKGVQVAWNKGKAWPEEFKRKSSESRKGIKRGPFSDETKRKMSEAHKGKSRQ